VAARAVFPDVEAAGRAAVAMIRTGMAVGRVELVDARTIEAVNAYKDTDYTVAPNLFLEFSGSEAGVEDDVAAARETSAAEGCYLFEVEADEAARERLWEARHEAAIAIQNLHPGTCASPSPPFPGPCATPATRSSLAAWKGSSWDTLGTETTTRSFP
jgi:D-lactate dehydrogenase (cytochrome)